MPKRSLLLVFIVIVIIAITGCAELLEEDSEDTRNTVDNLSDSFEMPSRSNNGESIIVDRVIDGDTLDLEDGRRVRLIGINTPERDQPFYDEATAFLRDRVEGKTIFLEYDEEAFDQFDRTLAYIWIGNDLVNAELLLGGVAGTYFIPPNNKYELEMRQAERLAMNEGVGIWESGDGGLEIMTIFFNAPGNDDENPNGEYIEIRNVSGNDLNLRGYTLQDSSSSNIYIFPSFSLDNGDIVTIYSGCGSDTSNELYWCDDSSIWNNSGDSAMLRDNEGLFVDSYEYSN